MWRIGASLCSNLFTGVWDLYLAVVVVICSNARVLLQSLSYKGTSHKSCKQHTRGSDRSGMDDDGEASGQWLE